MRRILGLGVLLLLVLLVLFVVPFPTHAQVPTRTFGWTAPGDDGDVGTAASYQMRYSTTRPDTTSASAKSSWWQAAIALAGLPAPLTAGTAQSATVGPTGGWTTGTSYYVVLRTLDEVGNISDFSNVALVLIPDAPPPAPIVDLSVGP